MPEQDPNVRIKNFDEVALGYTPETAMDEAKRCLNCKNMPCVSGCPVNVRIPEFIKEVAEGRFDEAYDIITSTNNLPAVCGRVCPQQTQCEGNCVRGLKGEPVAIGSLERFVADYHAAHNEESKKEEVAENNGHKVAVVGSGPTGLTCAADLARRGYDVTLFESFHKPGGVLVYGIPEFRLPKKVVAREIKKLEDFGVKIITNAVVGKAISIGDLFNDGFEAIYLGTGAGLPQFLHIEGESSLGVYSANEYLTRVNLMKANNPDYDTPIAKSKKIAVVGGGNVAMDAARVAKRMGADEVSIIYRRSEKELPARKEEIEHAKEESIDFKFLYNPVKIHSDENGRVCGIECVKMELGEPDASGRCRVSEIEGSNLIVDVDTVIVAIGTSPNPLIKVTTPEIEVNKRGCIVVDDLAATSIPGVFAGGDIASGASTVIHSMGAGKLAARSIIEYIDSLSKDKAE
ncbi:MAG: NADPH-dependent glutamate synthase [Clostridia bacterium]|nr:NADPH-dependent glutamate synthase [Clostridia bacterium]